MRDMVDKLVLGTKDDEALAEYFSRKAPGDTCKFTVEGTLDENHEGIVVLSVGDVKVHPHKDKKDSKSAAADESQPAIQMAKRRKAEQAEGMGY